jgi:hypothetical protein
MYVWLGPSLIGFMIDVLASTFRGEAHHLDFCLALWYKPLSFARIPLSDPQVSPFLSFL